MKAVRTTSNQLYVRFTDPLNTTLFPIDGLGRTDTLAALRRAPSGTGIVLKFSAGRQLALSAVLGVRHCCLWCSLVCKRVLWTWFLCVRSMYM